MQFDDLASYKFYFDKEGEDDRIATAIDCFETCIYIILKNKYPDEGDMITPLFLREINPTLWIDNTTGIFRIHNPNDNIIPLWKKFVKVEQLEKRHDEPAMQLLESLLEKNQMVMVQTVFAKIKYYAWHNPEYDVNTFVDGCDNHVSLVLGCEDDKIYFLDKKPYNLDMQYFVPCDFNREISIGDKKEFQEAFNYLLRCYVPSLDEAKVKEPAVYEKDLKEMLLKITEDYYAPAENVNGITKYYGASALQKLIEMCEAGEDIQNYYIIPDWQLLGNVTFDLWLIKGARSIMKEYVKDKAEKIKKPERLYRLIELLTKSVMYWDNLSAMFVKVIKSDGMRLNEKIANFVRKITSLENELNLEIRSVLQNDLLS
ncbi:MAG TPA: hypothetical protein VHT34_08740 [Clostridia bacterium]|nr:hypothetical protein [Clostridia bacterium]